MPHPATGRTDQSDGYHANAASDPLDLDFVDIYGGTRRSDPFAAQQHLDTVGIADGGPEHGQVKRDGRGLAERGRTALQSGDHYEGLPNTASAGSPSQFGFYHEKSAAYPSNAPMPSPAGARSMDLGDPAQHRHQMGGSTSSDSLSVHSRARLHYPQNSEIPEVPKVKIDPAPQNRDGTRPRAFEKAQGPGHHTPPPLSRGSTADQLHSGRAYTHLNDSTNMVFAEGDFLPSTKGSRACVALFSSNIFIRWFVFITPILALLWIPGIIGLTTAPDAMVWGVRLPWWSAWLSVWWGGWWAGLALAMLVPHLLHTTIGAVFPALRKWIALLKGMKTPITIFVWALFSWIWFNVFILRNQADGQVKSQGNGKVLHLMIQFLFGVLVSSMLLLGEKLVIQLIADAFHRKSYEDRIAEQKAAIRALIVLYINSHDIGRSDTLDRGMAGKAAKDPAKLLKSALKGVRNVAQASTTVFGTVASEIAGERILQPNAPDSMVAAALSSSNKTRQLARRLFFSFVPRGRNEMLLQDVAPYFPNREAAEAAFRFFDRDENGDASLEEMEMSCLDLHRERLALASSMRDLDSAVGRLDSILIFLFWIVAILIIVALLDVSFQTMLASAGTLVLGLSWLIGSTAQEVLSSIVFLFIKHPYDVSDRVDVDGQAYVVKEMSLLFTVFRQTDGKICQMPHSVLNTKSVVNIRRSGAISEPFEWSIAFGTTFEQIEQLRNRMLEFLEAESRDFLPSIDISIKDFAGQEKLTLGCDIKYKSNWQNGALKAQRRNKWLCGLKLAMAELSIFGPGGAGNPDPPPDPQLIKLVQDSAPLSPSPSKLGVAVGTDSERINTFTFASRDSAIQGEGEDIFDEQTVEGMAPLAHPPIASDPTRSAAGREGNQATARLRPNAGNKRGFDLEMQQR